MKFNRKTENRKIEVWKASCFLCSDAILPLESNVPIPMETTIMMIDSDEGASRAFPYTSLRLHHRKGICTLWKGESFTYTVYAPQTESVTKTQTVTNAVPVVKTRTVQRSVPKYSTQMVTKAYGETLVKEVAGSSYGAAPVLTEPSVSCSAPQLVQVTGSCGRAATVTVVPGGGCGNGLFGKSARGYGYRTHAASQCGCNSVSTSSNGSYSGCGSSMNTSVTSCGNGTIASGEIVSNGPPWHSLRYDRC